MADEDDRFGRAEIVFRDEDSSSDSGNGDENPHIQINDELMDRIEVIHEDVEDGNEEMEENADEESGDVCYDKSLPGTHSYLGSDLEEIRGRIIHDDETYVDNLPILALPNVVLMPGQTLPLHLFQPAMVAMISHVVQNDNTFGLVTASYQRQDFSASMFPIGTTAEVLAYKEESDDRAGISTVRVKAIGRQRFEIKESHRQADGILRAKVMIIPEQRLPPPLEGATTSRERRTCAFRHLSQTGSGDKNSSHSAKEFLVEQVKAELVSWNESLQEENMPSDPTYFSFWVAGNLPLDDDLKVMLLGINNTIQRLRCELGIMKKCTVLCCRDCDLQIADKKDMFSMSLEGPLGAYVNPGGHVHETLTLYKARGLHLIGRPSTENSWFPGYAWTIAQCRNCSQHMGWKFTSVSSKNKPHTFWGLCRSSLFPGIMTENGEDSPTQDETSPWRPSL